MKLRNGGLKIQKSAIKCYNRLMVRKIIAIEASEPKIKDIRSMGWMVVLLLVVAVFFQVMIMLNNSGANSLVAVVSESTWASRLFLSSWMLGVMVFVEIFAVPFLIGAKVSVLMRLMSMLFGWLVAGVFLVAMLALNLSGSGVSLVVADMMAIPLDWMFILLAVVFVAPIGWVTWGRWPEREIEMAREYDGSGVLSEVEKTADKVEKPKKSIKVAKRNNKA